MAKMTRPGFWTEANRCRSEAKWISRPTYRQLLRDLPALMKEYCLEEITIYRSRRGEWGEWFEYWHLHGSKITKGKEGWS